MKLYPAIILSILFTCCYNYLAAQGIRLTAQVQKNTIAIDQEVIITYKITGGNKVSSFETPVPATFEVTNSFESTRTEYNDLKKSGQTVISRTLTLRPLLSGEFTIPRASATVDGFPVSSQPVKIKVTGSNNGKRDINSIDLAVILPGETARQKANDEIHIVQEISKTTCYVGENILADATIFTRLPAQYSFLQMPGYEGFSLENRYKLYSNKPVLKEYKGKTHQSFLIRSVHLFPLQEGELVIAPMQIDAKIDFKKIINVNLPNEGLINESYRHTAVSNAIKVTVKPLPEANKPAGFSGAIGSFNIHYSLDSDTIHTEEPARLNIILEGQGNLPLVNSPTVEWPASFNVSKTATHVQYNAEAFPFAGKKVFEIPFYVTEAGSYTIPGIRFSYFDAEHAQYHTILTDSITLHVLPSNYNSSGPPEKSGQLSYWLWLIPVIIVGMVLLFIRKKRKKNKQISSVVKFNEQEKDASTPVLPLPSEWKTAYWNNDTNGFYKAIQQTLKIMVENKTRQSFSTIKELQDILTGSKFSAQEKEQVLELYQSAQWALYGQSFNEEQYTSHYQMMERLLRAMENR